jgi:predicted ATPase
MKNQQKRQKAQKETNQIMSNKGTYDKENRIGEFNQRHKPMDFFAHIRNQSKELVAPLRVIQENSYSQAETMQTQNDQTGTIC